MLENIFTRYYILDFTECECVFALVCTIPMYAQHTHMHTHIPQRLEKVSGLIFMLVTKWQHIHTKVKCDHMLEKSISSNILRMNYSKEAFLFKQIYIIWSHIFLYLLKSQILCLCITYTLLFKLSLFKFNFVNISH